jgi:hypothetical protein
VPQLPAAALDAAAELRRRGGAELPGAAAALRRREEAELPGAVAALRRREEAELPGVVAELRRREAELPGVVAVLRRREAEPLGAAQWPAAGLLSAGPLARVAAGRWEHARQTFAHSSAAPPRSPADCARVHWPAARRRSDVARPVLARSAAAVHSAK